MKKLINFFKGNPGQVSTVIDAAPVNATHHYVANAPKSDSSYKPTAANRIVSRNFNDDLKAFIRAEDSGIAMDAVENLRATMDSNLAFKDAGAYFNTMPEGVLEWFASLGFIGYQTCALLAQNAYINKACGIPVDDALRKWYELSFMKGEEVDEKLLAKIKKSNKKYKLKKNIKEFGYFSRVFGIRIALFQVKSNDPRYYEKPFNIDSVKPDSYLGISQVDPYWVTPQLDTETAANPVSQNFYEPTWWRIGPLLVHHTHLVIARYEEVADVLKPAYFYGGMSLPQQIFERVWAAERISNEAPKLVLTKRTKVIGIDLAIAAADQEQFDVRTRLASQYQDNFGTQYIDKDDTAQQFDVALGDVDTLIMTQFQLVAAIAKMPAVKLMGTSPKGFQATGEHEEASYHENLETIQSHTLTPLLERHYQLVFKSEIQELDGQEFDIVWNPLDTTTYKGKAENNLLKMQTDAVAVQNGIIEPAESRSRIINDPESGYNGLEAWDETRVSENIENYYEAASKSDIYRK